MYDIQDPFAHVSFLRKWRSALLSELACFAYARDLLRGKVRESEYDSFRLHVLKLLEIDMANSLVPHVQVGFDFEALCKHGRFYLGRCEDKHATFTTAVSYDLIASFDEAPIIVESYLHSLFDKLADRDQVFCDGTDMQYVLEVGLFAIVSEWDDPDTLYWMSRVIACLDISGSFGFL